VAALEHANWIAYLTGVIACTDGAEVVRDGGVVTILSGLPFDWFNQVLVETDSATSDDVLSGVDRGRRYGLPFVVRLRNGTDDRFIPVLRDAGFTPQDGVPTPGMVAHPIDRLGLDAAHVPGLEIRRLSSLAEIDRHSDVATAGFGTHPSVARGITCPDLLERSECSFYLGFVDGVPVVSGLGWTSGATIGVYSIATVPTARRRGYGAAMTARVVIDGQDAGHHAAALQASEMGRPIYERLGFRTVVQYVGFQEPGR
jgi:GNAT superfamily N-acetyltransferase